VNTTPVNTWLYAVVQVPPYGLPEELTGVAGEPLRLLNESGLAAVAGSVPRADFDEEALNARIQDPEWLERAVRDHHRVICVLGRTHRLLPMRFATLCQDDARAVALLTERRERLVAAVEHVGARTELGVKAWAVPHPKEASDVPASGTPGAAYLARLRTRRDERERSQQVALDQANRLHAQLAAVAADWVQHPPQPGAATGRDEPMLLNCAYLVDDDRIPMFRSAVSALSADLGDLDLELTGPWPPYSFADLDRPGPVDGETR
jgi:hypothetical protein